MRSELNGLRELLEVQLGSLAWNQLQGRHPQQANLWRRLQRMGLSAELLQKLDRDTHKMALKCSAISIGGQWRDVFKDPVTDPGKRSLGGRVVGYEANGGFLLGFPATLASENLAPLATRDSLLPIIAPLSCLQKTGSLADLVAQITGVTVRERVPDIVLKRADEVLLVDLAPSELIERLKEGKVYLPESANRAVDRFFRLGNLTALVQKCLDVGRD